MGTVFTTPAVAQGCAMCQTVLPHASEPIARGMFWCVLLLLTAPFAVSISIGGWLFYQYRRRQRSVQNQALPVKLILPRPEQYSQEGSQ
jgi:hypothetical protein